MMMSSTAGKQPITSDSDHETEIEEEPTPRPRKTRNRSSSPEEVDVGDDEHFKTPRTLKPKKIAAVETSSDLSELSDSEESGSEDNGDKRGKKTLTKVRGKDNSLKAEINLTTDLDDVTVM
jgi:hypothetical protein